MGVLLEQRDVDGVRLVDRLHRVAESLRFGSGDPLGHDLGVTTGSMRAVYARLPLARLTQRSALSDAARTDARPSTASQDHHHPRPAGLLAAHAVAGCPLPRVRDDGRKHLGNTRPPGADRQRRDGAGAAAGTGLLHELHAGRRLLVFPDGTARLVDVDHAVRRGLARRNASKDPEQRDVSGRVLAGRQAVRVPRGRVGECWSARGVGPRIRLAACRGHRRGRTRERMRAHRVVARRPRDPDGVRQAPGANARRHRGGRV